MDTWVPVKSISEESWQIRETALTKVHEEDMAELKVQFAQQMKEE
jgi:hypothetical protein